MVREERHLAGWSYRNGIHVYVIVSVSLLCLALFGTAQGRPVHWQPLPAREWQAFVV